MYEGKQVLRFENNYKSKDLYNIGNEMQDRIGTGNYDPERTKFNLHFKDIEKYNLYQEVKYQLESRNIEYLHKNKTNLLNGVNITSGPEFFMNLGMKFKPSGRYYQSGEKKGQDILVPDIKSEEDIPPKVYDYFINSYEFLAKLVGEENIVLAHVHLDEDTPHLQAYFLPVVDKVKRKCYQRDKDGNLIKELKIDYKGKPKEVPILLRDDEGKIVYEEVEGKFLNNDQFWKDLGGRNSFASIQDEFNKYMKEKGFNLDRGEKGANKQHKTKLEHQVDELKAESNNLWNQISSYKVELENSKDNLKNVLKPVDMDLIVKKRFTGYSSKDVEDLIENYDNLQKQNFINELNIKDKDRELFSLKLENDRYKNHKELFKLNEENNYLNQQLRNKDANIDYYKSGFKKVCRALDLILRRPPMLSFNDYISLAEDVAHSKRAMDIDEEAWEEFQKMNENKDNDSSGLSV